MERVIFLKSAVPEILGLAMSCERVNASSNSLTNIF